MRLRLRGSIISYNTCCDGEAPKGAAWRQAVILVLTLLSISACAGGGATSRGPIPHDPYVIAKQLSHLLPLDHVKDLRVDTGTVATLEGPAPPGGETGHAVLADNDGFNYGRYKRVGSAFDVQAFDSPAAAASWAYWFKHFGTAFGGAFVSCDQIIFFGNWIDDGNETSLQEALNRLYSNCPDLSRVDTSSPESPVQQTQTPTDGGGGNAVGGSSSSTPNPSDGGGGNAVGGSPSSTPKPSPTRASDAPIDGGYGFFFSGCRIQPPDATGDQYQVSVDVTNRSGADSSGVTMQVLAPNGGEIDGAGAPTAPIPAGATVRATIGGGSSGAGNQPTAPPASCADWQWHVLAY